MITTNQKKQNNKTDVGKYFIPSPTFGIKPFQGEKRKKKNTVCKNIKRSNTRGKYFTPFGVRGGQMVSEFNVNCTGSCIKLEGGGGTVFKR